MREGWICPKCGKALAPWMSECPCNYISLEVTSNYTINMDVSIPNFELNEKAKGDLDRWLKTNSETLI